MVNVFSFEELRELKGVKELRHYSPSPPVFSPPDGLLSEPPEGLLPEPPEELLPEPPDGVVVPPPVVPPGFVVEEVTRMSAASLRVASRSRRLLVSLPVARARSLTPSMFFATVKDSFVSAPFLGRMPMEKMARSSIFTE